MHCGIGGAYVGLMATHVPHRKLRTSGRSFALFLGLATAVTVFSGGCAAPEEDESGVVEEASTKASETLHDAKKLRDKYRETQAQLGWELSKIRLALTPEQSTKFAQRFNEQEFVADALIAYEGGLVKLRDAMFTRSGEPTAQVRTMVRKNDVATAKLVYEALTLLADSSKTADSALRVSGHILADTHGSDAGYRDFAERATGEHDGAKLNIRVKKEIAVPAATRRVSHYLDEALKKNPKFQLSEEELHSILDPLTEAKHVFADLPGIEAALNRLREARTGASFKAATDDFAKNFSRVDDKPIVDLVLVVGTTATLWMARDALRDHDYKEALINFVHATPDMIEVTSSLVTYTGRAAIVATGLGRIAAVAEPGINCVVSLMEAWGNFHEFLDTKDPIVAVEAGANAVVALAYGAMLFPGMAAAAGVVVLVATSVQLVLGAWDNWKQGREIRDDSKQRLVKIGLSESVADTLVNPAKDRFKHLHDDFGVEPSQMQQIAAQFPQIIRSSLIHFDADAVVKLGNAFERVPTFRMFDLLKAATGRDPGVATGFINWLGAVHVNGEPKNGAPKTRGEWVAALSTAGVDLKKLYPDLALAMSGSAAYLAPMAR